MYQNTVRTVVMMRLLRDDGCEIICGSAVEYAQFFLFAKPHPICICARQGYSEDDVYKYHLCADCHHHARSRFRGDYMHDAAPRAMLLSAGQNINEVGVSNSPAHRPSYIYMYIYKFIFVCVYVYV